MLNDSLPTYPITFAYTIDFLFPPNVPSPETTLFTHPMNTYDYYTKWCHQWSMVDLIPIGLMEIGVAFSKGFIDRNWDLNRTLRRKLQTSVENGEYPASDIPEILSKYEMTGPSMNRVVEIHDPLPMLKSLEYGCTHNQEILPGSLPSSLEKLILGYQYNQPLYLDSLPSGLTTLKLGASFNKTIDPGVLPSSITSLRIGHHYNQPIESLPLCLESLSLDCINIINIGSFPPRLKKIKMRSCVCLPMGSIPETVTEIKISFNEIIPMYWIPDWVTDLTLGGYYNQRLDINTLPLSLVRLTLGDRYNQPIDPCILPNRLEYLTFGKEFNQPISPGVLPHSLTHLVIRCRTAHSHDLNRCLPPKLKHLTLGSHRHPITVNTLPKSLVYLEIQDRYDQRFTHLGSVKELVLEDYTFSHGYIDLGIAPSLTNLTMQYGCTQPKSWAPFYNLLSLGVTMKFHGILDHKSFVIRQLDPSTYLWIESEHTYFTKPCFDPLINSINQ
eukprot:gene7278-8459_t